MANSIIVFKYSLSMMSKIIQIDTHKQHPGEAYCL